MSENMNNEHPEQPENENKNFFDEGTVEVPVHVPEDATTKIYEIPHEAPEKTVQKHNEQKKKKRRHDIFVFFTCLLVVLVMIEVIGGVTGLLLVNSMLEDSPELKVEDFVSQESSLIYDAQGNVITEVGVYYRENVPYEMCPESLVDAFLAIEDSRYFTHFGFDIPRFTKAALENLKNHNFGQGGSTFTMQLVKNTYFSIDSMDASNTGTERTKSIEYKVQQIALAIQLDRLMNKKEIFQLYLNKLNFGGRIRGVERASTYYFGKHCYELSLPESAMLAGIINLPNGYNPYYHLDDAAYRRNQVLDAMAYHGYITAEECALAKKVKVEDLLIGETRAADTNSRYQSYIDVALDEAERLTGEDPTIRGMEIYTYMQPSVQTEIEAIQNEETAVAFPDELMQVAIISLDNRNGAIVGIGGGRNYDGARLLNRATMNYKQPGSSIKPVLSYALAYEYLGYSLDEILLDKPITYPQESMVLVNATGKYTGDVTIKDAVGSSLNIPAILTLQRVVDAVGKDKVVNYLNSIGFSRVTKDNFHLSFAIGGTLFETTVKELAGAHAMLINGGVYNEPHTIAKIVMQDGTEYYPQNQNRQVLSSGSAWLTCQLMENNVSGTYWNYMDILRRSYPVYAKTGTTDWGRDGIPYGIPIGQMKDKWMVASTSHYTNCVWVGYDMAVAGKQTYYTNYKSQLNIPGNINRLLLNVEEDLSEDLPEPVKKPEDVIDVRYVYGSWPHVQAESWMDPANLITSQESKAGLEAKPLMSSEEFRASLKKDGDDKLGITATYDQYGTLHVTWGTNGDFCAGGKRNISLH
ncbi:MAG: transglycosylase domain-containing protein, partial [Solobacterium sp.]|nr:transglycosylase domain-containing protein [Solobacterium sp.]